MTSPPIRCSPTFAGLLLVGLWSAPSIAAEGRPWPKETRIEHQSDYFNLLVFVHPHCRCSRDIGEHVLAVLATADAPTKTTFVFYRTDGESDGWPQGAAWDQLAAAGEHTLLIDRGGVEAKNFGVSSSGHFLLFDGRRRLLFSGGLGAGRDGTPSPGAIAALRSHLDGRDAAAEFPVVGCALQQESSLAKYDFFTNYGAYMPRVHCLQTAEGDPDWPWITGLIVLNLVVLAGYIKIIRVWRACYLAEEQRDRDPKLMDLAWIFFFCGLSGYGISTVIFFWPAYRLLALFLLLLAIVTWRFAYDLRDFQQSFSVRRRGREEREVLEGEIADIATQKQTLEHRAHAEKLESIGSLASGIAHEINTPMQFIGVNVSYLGQAMGHWAALQAAVRDFVDRNGEGGLDRLRESLPNEEFLQASNEAIADCRTGVERVSEIIGAMKEFAHPDSDDGRPFDVNHCIENAATLTRNATKQHAVVELDLGECQPVEGSASAMNQAFVNLIVNAADAIEESSEGGSTLGRISISTRQADGRVVVRISDTGCGMPPQVAAKAFDPFFTTKEVGKGSGQGLSIAYNAVVKKCHGQIAIDSSPGEGTTFTITLLVASCEDSPTAAGDTRELHASGV